MVAISELAIEAERDIAAGTMAAAVAMAQRSPEGVRKLLDVIGRFEAGTYGAVYIDPEDDVLYDLAGMLDILDGVGYLDERSEILKERRLEIDPSLADRVT